MNIKAKDMILINMEIIKVKSDTIYELFPWYDINVYHFYFWTFFFNLSNLLNFYLHLYWLLPKIVISCPFHLSSPQALLRRNGNNFIYLILELRRNGNKPPTRLLVSGNVSNTNNNGVRSTSLTTAVYTRVF